MTRTLPFENKGYGVGIGVLLEHRTRGNRSGFTRFVCEDKIAELTRRI
jgi:hypothetical protein